MTPPHTLSRCACAAALSIIALGCTRPRPPTTPAHPTPAQGPKAAQPAAEDVPATIDAEALESTATKLASKVTRVTVYSDRARVTRAATAQLDATPTVFAFRGLPGWVDDGSVRVVASAGRIVDVRVERAFLARASDAGWQRADADNKRLLRRLAALRDELAVLQAQRAQIESIKAFSLEKITKNTTIGDVSVKSYGEVLMFISDSLRKTAVARRAAQQKIDELDPQYQASVRKLAEMKSLGKLEETSVLVTLQAGGPTASTVELTYMLPGVTWEPVHELRVSTANAKQVEVVSFASVTQTSGEDWGDAALSFSTQSSTQSVRIPELEALTLGDTHTATRTLTRQMSSFSRAQHAFETQSQLWNKVHQRPSARRESASFDRMYQSNVEYLEVVQGKTVQIFESLRKRGTTAHFKANAAPSVRGDGHPVRMRIGRSTLGSRQQIVAAPEQSLNAARTLAMLNDTGQPLLPGKVALYQDGAFLGMTEIDFIAEGEPFSLFVSVADHVKLSRKLDRKRSSLIRKKRNRMQLAFIVTVENLSNAPTSLTLTDRIPVSENRDITISRVKIAPAARPDSQGLLSWELSLKPKEQRVFRISYQVDYPAELVIESRRKRMREPAPSPDSPARPVERKKYRIEEQLMDLEEQL